MRPERWSLRKIPHQEGVATLGLVCRVLRQPEMPLGVVLPGVVSEIRVLLSCTRLYVAPVAPDDVAPCADQSSARRTAAGFTLYFFGTAGVRFPGSTRTKRRAQGLAGTRRSPMAVSVSVVPCTDLERDERPCSYERVRQGLCGWTVDDWRNEMTNNRRLRTPQIVLVACVGLLLLAVAARDAGGTSSETVTIRLVSTPGTETFKDVPPKLGASGGRLSKGDVGRGTSILKNAVAQFGKPKGAVVGSDVYTMTVTRAPFKIAMSVKVKLPDGTIQAKGPGDLRAPALTITVVGGTGAYAGARGTSTASGLSGNRSSNVYRLRLP